MASENAQKKQHRVALFVSEYTVFHYSVFLRHLLVGLADESVPVALICPQQCDIDSIILGAVDIIRYPVIELPLAGRFNNKLLLEQLLKFKPTVLHCVCESLASVTKEVAQKMDLPYVLSVNSLHGRFGNIPVSHIHCRKIIVPSSKIAENLTKLNPRFDDLIQLIPYGIYVSDKISCFSEQSDLISEQADSSKSYTEKSQTTIIMAYPSQQTNEIDNIFNSLRHLKIEGYEFLLFLINIGNVRPQTSFFSNGAYLKNATLRTERKIWKLLSLLDLVQDVTIVPQQIPWHTVLSTGDIFIYPIKSYAFNSILIEAMSLGNAIATVSGGLDEPVIEDETAVIMDTSDELHIMRTLQKMLDRHEFARKLAVNSQKYIKKNHSVSKFIEETLSVYNEL